MPFIQLTKRFLHQHRIALIGIVVLALLTMRHGTAFMLLFYIMPVTYWMVYRGVVCRHKPRERRALLVSATLWSTGIALILAWHGYRNIDNRVQANLVAQRLEQFRQAEGKYPPSLEWIGYEPRQLQARMGLRYSKTDDTPQLRYSSAFNLFDHYAYDFQFRDWNAFRD